MVGYFWDGNRKKNEMTSTILDSLEDIAYLAANAFSVEDRRFLDLVLQVTETSVDDEDEDRETIRVA